MKWNRLITLFCLHLLFFQASCSADTDHRVKWVVDGDTIVLTGGTKVRYIGINAPELARDDHVEEPFGIEAKRFNSQLVNKKKVRLEFDTEPNDRYQRRLAYVFLKDGTFVNAAMISAGFAHLLYLKPNVKYVDKLLAQQREAMMKGRGIWSNWNEQNATYIGNKRSRRFHLATCSSGKRIKPSNRIIFKKQWDAYWEGYAPAGRCMPVFTIPKD